MTNTQRTLNYLRAQGFLAEIVERFIKSKPHGKRKDYLGIIDIIAVDGPFTVGVQSCGSDFAAHDKKILESKNSTIWMDKGVRDLMLIGWRKVKYKRGSKAVRWAPRIKLYKPEDFE